MKKVIIIIIFIVIVLIIFSYFFIYPMNQEDDKKIIYKIKLYIFSESPNFNSSLNETGNITVWLDGNEIISIKFFQDDGHHPRYWNLDLTEGEHIIKVYDETIDISNEKIININKETIFIGIKIWHEKRSIEIDKSNVPLIID